jgi:hypothetical protein
MAVNSIVFTILFLNSIRKGKIRVNKGPDNSSTRWLLYFFLPLALVAVFMTIFGLDKELDTFAFILQICYSLVLLGWIVQEVRPAILLPS